PQTRRPAPPGKLHRLPESMCPPCGNACRDSRCEWLRSYLLPEVPQKQTSLTHLSQQDAQSVGSIHIAILRFAAIAFDRHRVSLARSQEKIVFDSMLPRIQVVVTSARSIKFRMRPALHDPALFHDHDLIRAPDSRESMRDH